MTIPIMITTKADAILELIQLRETAKTTGSRILYADTYSFKADNGITVSHTYWDGTCIVSDIDFK